MKRNYVVGVVIGAVLLTAFYMNNRVQKYQAAYETSQKQVIKISVKNKSLQVNNADLRAEIKSVNDVQDKEIESKQNDDQLKQFINTMLTYNNDSYVDRFNKAEQFADKQAISIFRLNADKIETPKTTIDSKVTDYKFYVDPTSNGLKGIVVIKTDFEYQGQSQKPTFEYDVQLASDGHVQKLAQRVIE